MIKNYFLVFAILIGCITNAQQSGSGSVNVQIQGTEVICNPGFCVTLSANLLNAKGATDYTVASIPYNPPYSFSGGTILDNTADDVFSPLQNLPFPFCFYGNTYNSLVVGSNGVISFDSSLAGEICNWNFNTAIPDTNFPIKNAIYGVYQDTDVRPTAPGMVNPALQNINYYVNGVSPNRVFVANFNELPLFQGPLPSSDLQTSQIVLYESSNVIDIYVKKRTPNTWNQGVGVIGIQNASGTLATFPANRNTGNWSTTYEAWRFKPSGADFTASYAWTSSDGVSGTNNTLTVCPTATTSYNVSVLFSGCDGIEQVVTQQLNLIVEAPMNIQNPVDISMCSLEETAIFNIDSDALMLNAVNPVNFETAYYTTFADAENWNSNNINDLANFVAFNGQVIYVRVTNIASQYSCYEIKSFTLNIETPPSPPTGDSEQTFNEGGTLADLELDGDNIQWYDEAEGGSPLPLTTPLVDEETYFATQTSSENGCESSFRVLQNRFPVTVFFVPLGTPEWTIKNLKVAPNPVKDMVTISSETTITSVEIYSLLGQKVLTQSINATTSQINLSKLATGHYMMKVIADNQMKTIKIVKL